MRGDLPVRNDTEVTEADVRDEHLILFGDPGSNSWIARALPDLPVNWTPDDVSIDEDVYARYSLESTIRPCGRRQARSTDGGLL